MEASRRKIVEIALSSEIVPAPARRVAKVSEPLLFLSTVPSTDVLSGSGSGLNVETVNPICSCGNQLSSQRINGKKYLRKEFNLKAYLGDA